MKKLVIVAIAVLLALPVLSHAGSATSKWDLTIGGYVLTQAGWADQAVGSGVATAQRRSARWENYRDEFGNLFAHSEGRLNFTMKGPDALGAKTAGRLEFDFLSNASGVQGDGVLRHAYFTFDWPTTQLLLGNTWYGAYDTGMPPGGATLASLPNPGIPSRAPQIRLTQKIGKMFTATFGLEYPGLGKWMAARNDYYDNYTMSEWPNFFGTFVFASDVCGKIGPNMLKIGMSGVYGRQGVMRQEYLNEVGTLNDRYVYSRKQEDGWLAHGFVYVPIIPEKNMNKAGALAWYGGVLVGQGLNNYNSTVFQTTYLRNYKTNVTGNTELYPREYSTPRGVGMYTGLWVYLTNELYLSGQYTDQKAYVSNYWRRYMAGQNTVIRNQLYNIALVYEPTAAIQLGVEYTRLLSTYAQYQGYVYSATNAGNLPGQNGQYSRHGVLNEVRFSAKYNF